MTKYYVVSSEILPEVMDKVLEAQHLLQTGQVRRISEAVKQVGISRGTFYKYKDAVFGFNEDQGTRKAILTLVIRHEKGTLARVINSLSQMQANILSINQTSPINGIASLTVTVDMSDMAASPQEALELLRGQDGVEQTELVAVE